MDTIYAMMFYGNYMCNSVLLGGIFPFPTPPLLYMTPSSPSFTTNIPVIYTCIGPLLFYALLFLFCYCSLCMLHSLLILASYTQALKGCMFMRLQAGIFTLHACAMGKLIGLSVCRCRCHCRRRHENLKL